MINAKKIIKIAIFLIVLYILFSFVILFAFDKKISQELKNFDPTTLLSSEQSSDMVDLISNSEDGFDARLQMIDEAKETLVVSYYATHYGNSTKVFFAKVLEAAERGVKVRMVFDGFSSGLGREAATMTYAMASHKNIEIFIYNTPTILKPWTFNGRMHDKYIIADSKRLMLGGRNLGDKYFISDYKKKASLDYDLILETSKVGEGVIKDVESYFEIILNENATKQFTVTKNQEKLGLKEREILSQCLREYEDANPKRNFFGENLVKTNKVSLLYNPTHIMRKEPVVGYSLYRLAMLDEVDEVIIQSPYFVLDKNFKKAYSHIASAKPITFLTNSSSSSLNPLGNAFYMWSRNSYDKMEIPIYEYQSKHQLHGKGLVLGDRISVIGSFNMDPRSAYLDTELMLVVDSEDYNQVVRSHMRAYQDQSLLFEDGEYRPKEGQEVVPTPFWKVIMIAVVGFIGYPFKFLT